MDNNNSANRLPDSHLESAAWAARMLGVTPEHLATMRYRGQGPAYVRLSKRCVKYNPTTVMAWIQSHTIEEGL